MHFEVLVEDQSGALALEEIIPKVLGSNGKPHSWTIISYRQDSICGTWETLADAVFPGGAAVLKKTGRPHPGEEKCNWARAIAPRMDIYRNKSKSFQVFRDCLISLANQS